jgi:hypothetical protein
VGAGFLKLALAATKKDHPMKGGLLRKNKNALGRGGGFGLGGLGGLGRDLLAFDVGLTALLFFSFVVLLAHNS